MIITKEMIDTVRPFAEGYPKDAKKYPKADRAFQQILGTRSFELVLRLTGSNTELATFNFEFPNMKIELCKGDEFTFATFIFDNGKPHTLDLFITMGARCISIQTHQQEIEKLIRSLFKDRDQYIFLEKQRDMARWCFSTMQAFFVRYGGELRVDTEEVLKRLWKIKIGDKDKPFFIKRHKNEDFDWMRRIVSAFYETYQAIENNPSLVISLSELKTPA